MKTFLASLLLALFSLNAMATNHETMMQSDDTYRECVMDIVDEAQAMGADIDEEVLYATCGE